MENFLFDAIVELIKGNVDFVVCGGIACFLQGSDRNSFDLDIAVDLNDDNLRRLIAVAKRMAWIPRIPEPIENIMDPIKRKEWVDEKAARVFTLNATNGLLQIDVFLTYPIDFPELKKDANIFNIEDIEFRVSSIPHLIKAKRLIETKRRQDLYDIEVLEEMLHGNKT
ncbi:MAG: hypothetical protein ACM3SY_12685 [Candidatus Omnitrophota bacterium]